MIVRFLEGVRVDHLVHASEVLMVAAVAALIGGILAKRRRIAQGALAFLVSAGSATVANALLVLWVEPSHFDSPRVPGWSRAPLVGLSVLAASGFAGAVARRWRPWAGVWLGAAVAGGIAAGVVAWGQLDRLIVYPTTFFARCRPLYLSTADVVASAPQWLLVALAGGLGAALLPRAVDRASSNPLRVVADVAGLASAFLVVAASARDVARPQLDHYVAALPTMGPLRVQDTVGPDDLGFHWSEEQIAREQRFTSAPFRLPQYLRFEHPPAAGSLELYRDEGGQYLWRWGPTAPLTHGVSNERRPGETYDLRYDATSDVWLLVTRDDGPDLHAVEWLREPSEPRVVLADPMRAMMNDPAAWEPYWRQDYLPLDRVARSVAPPWSWTIAAALAVAVSWLLGRSRFESEPSRRTIASMRLAGLAAGVTPLAIAAWRGFVLPW